MKVKQGFRKKFHRSLTSSAGASYPMLAGVLVLVAGGLVAPVFPPFAGIILVFAAGLLSFGALSTLIFPGLAAFQ